MSLSVSALSGLSSRLQKLPESVTDLLNAFISQATRLLEIRFSPDSGIPEGKFLVHRIKGEERVNWGFRYEVWVFSQDAHFPLKTLLSVPTQITILTDSGGKRFITGVITEVHSEGSDGGLSTYRLVVEPVTAALRLGHSSQIFMQKNDLEIVKLLLNKEIQENPVFGACFSIDNRCLKTKTYPVRDFAFLCDENKWDFIRRRLAKIGVSFVILPHPDSSPEHPQHSLILFDDPRDLDKNEAGEVRFHRADGTEEADTITSWQAQRVLQVGKVTRRAWDHSNGSLSTTSEELLSNQGSFGNALASTLEDYRHEAPLEHDDLAGHEKRTTSRAQVWEQRTKCFAGEGTVRDFCVGTSFVLEDHPVHDADPKAQRTFVLTGLELEAENNFGGLKTGHEAAQVYTNRFECLRQSIPILPEEIEAPIPGPITATVVGPEGEEVHTDEVGRIKVELHCTRKEDHPLAGATGTDRDCTWVRLLQPWSSQGMGGGFLPRAGDEVLIQFLNNDPDKPVVLGVLPGGRRKPAMFSLASSLPGDKAISGMRSKMHKGTGGNELLFDDSTNELRARLASDHAKTELNLGHIVHPRALGLAEPKGTGFELRSEAYGALRGEKGLLISTEGGSAALESAGLHSQLEGGQELAKALSEVSEKHQLEALGTLESAKKLQETLKKTETTKGNEIPAFADPVLALSSPAGIVQSTPASVITSAGEHIHLDSCGDTVVAAGKRIMMAAKEAFQVFAAKSGIKAIAGKGNIDIQAHEGKIGVVADQDVQIVSANNSVEILAKTSIRLAANGCEILLKDGKITLKMPGNLELRTGGMKLMGAGTANVDLPKMPRASIPERQFKFDLNLADTSGSNGHPLSFTPWKIAWGPEPDGLAWIDEEHLVTEGETDSEGHIPLSTAQEELLSKTYCANPDRTWLVFPGHVVKIAVAQERDDWSEDEKLLHALSAADFTQDTCSNLYSTGVESVIDHAHAVFGTKSKAELLNRLKGGLK
ncbi:type VI secretion system Vgr family protein [Holophaga foetida]|uniref:type VI secretion system Vgr family protein n=1 Tax=Holophaga foetida TaxID=35839 RepID=UPI0002472A77|nr:type VI secretion system Vgr family protein [Holophaga foetida]